MELGIRARAAEAAATGRLCPCGARWWRDWFLLDNGRGALVQRVTFSAESDPMMGEVFGEVTSSGNRACLLLGGKTDFRRYRYQWQHREL